MFDSRSPIIKIGGYAIIGFFTLIIVIQFGMPDFVSKMGGDENIVATVNGEKIYRMDFLKYRDRVVQRMPNMNKDEARKMILDDLIIRRLLLQMANEIGIAVSDSRVRESIKQVPIFKNDKGVFTKELLDRYLTYTHENFSDFFFMIKEEIIMNELRQMLDLSQAVSPDEILKQNAVDKSNIEIKYCYISNSDLRQKFAAKIAVTEEAIDKELKNSKEEKKDPKTDKERIRNKLEQKNFDAIKKDIVGNIDKLAQEGKPFEMASALLGGKIFTSASFKIGEPVKQSGKDGRPLYFLTNSGVFTDNLLKVEKGKTSKVVDTVEGLYVFTPVRKDISFKEPVLADQNKMTENLLREKSTGVLISVLTSLKEKAKIVRNANFN